MFVLEEFRGNGLGKWLVECVPAHEKLRGLRGMLNTKDAHSLYEKFGFSCLLQNISTGNCKE
ncbi:GNAT family N-acetyltransferase [Mesotoga sp.]|uniref:GNAT family N-acetyltransferase n=1 Tax=Mesotoga sp. TaxID=2053577 RepID=UPI00345EDC88